MFGVPIELTDSVKKLFKETACQLKGTARRRFQAQVVMELGHGGQLLAQKELGWDKWGDINKRQTLDTAPKALCPLHRQSLSLIDHPKRFAVYFSLGT